MLKARTLGNYEKAKSVVASEPTSVDALTDEAQNRFDRFLPGAHPMTACALAAIDTCSADVHQTAHPLELLVLLFSRPQPFLISFAISVEVILKSCLRQSKEAAGRSKNVMESLRSAFEKHMTEYEEEEQKYTQSLWGSSMSTQEQDLQSRLEAGNQLQKKQKVGEALLWLELMSGPPAV